MESKKYEFAENVVDTGLFEQDSLAFTMLTGFVNNKSTLVITDHDKYVICYSQAPFPVWVWTAEGISETKKDEVWKLFCKEQLLPGETGKYAITGINMKYDMAEYFLKRAEMEKKNLRITMNMLAYDCRKLRMPDKEVEGRKGHMTEEDLADVSEFIWQFKQEIGTGKEEKDACREHAKNLVGNPDFYLWKDAQGRNVAMCNYHADGGIAKVGMVFCKTGERRKGYAENLVYEVTKAAKEKGLLPALYTNADYAASNGCYIKVGYEPRGRLCRVGI